MDKKYTELFNRLNVYMNIEAMSRYEEPVVDELKNSIKGNAYKASRDGFGSVIFYKKSKNPNAPKVMLAAHMDEVGYIVRSIEENGNLLVSSIGGVWPSVVIGTKVTVVSNATNKKYTGVFGHTSIHILEQEKAKQALKEKELFVDLGFMKKQEVLDEGIDIGDRIYLSGETVILANNLVGGKAMDNRAGVTAIEFIANAVSDLDLDVDLYIVGTVQEEVGLRGAKTSVSLINPDVAFAIDTGASHDTTGCIKGTPSLGKGVNLLVKDGETLSDPKILEMLMHLAKTHNIPTYKYIAMGGGTDASVLQYGKGGTKTVSISIPQRYLHSPIGVASLVDIQATIDLMVEFIKNYNPEKHQELSCK
ncbi:MULTISPECIES: M42 family metallopeptidase [unclassified Mycoplasma]|uniref:M42 family metallopeptidase n=1 Tax=unclassified Mycoplasma TaxID=2683645 RepID=UPI00211CB764|nr:MULTISPECIES: M42 family metallopeptidase [unclassified Mycoplasma]UUM19639.1 M42 family metallopeptidase [Mycoplasma sp. 1578d]UUM24608.1 M42 family metallopeptidase [Mycoplasma sp. 3686d]